MNIPTRRLWYRVRNRTMTPQFVSAVITAVWIGFYITGRWR